PRRRAHRQPRQPLERGDHAPAHRPFGTADHRGDRLARPERGGALPTSSAGDRRGDRRGPTPVSVDLLEAFREAWRSLAGNKLRSGLTMLGVIIGVGAVIALISLGKGVEGFIKAQFSDIGTNLVVVQPGKVET